MYRNRGNVQGQVQGMMVSDDSADEYDWDVSFDPPGIPPRRYFNPSMYTYTLHPTPPSPSPSPRSTKPTVVSRVTDSGTMSIRLCQRGEGWSEGVTGGGGVDSGDGESDLEEEYEAYPWHNYTLHHHQHQQAKVNGSPKQRRRRFQGLFATRPDELENQMNGSLEGHRGEDVGVPFRTFRNPCVSESSSCESSAPTEYFSLDMDTGGVCPSATELVGQAGSAMGGRMKECPCCHQLVGGSVHLDYPTQSQSQSERKDESTSTRDNDWLDVSGSSVQFLYRHPVGPVGPLGGSPGGTYSLDAFDSFPFGSMVDESTSTLSLQCELEYELAKETLQKVDAMSRDCPSEEDENEPSVPPSSMSEDEFDECLSSDGEIIELVDRSTSTPSLPVIRQAALHASTSTTTFTQIHSKEAQVQTEGEGNNLNFDIPSSPTHHPPPPGSSKSDGDAPTGSGVGRTKEKQQPGIPRSVKLTNGNVTPPPPPPPSPDQGQVSTPSRIPRKVLPLERHPSLIPKPTRGGGFCPTALRIEK